MRNLYFVLVIFLCLVTTSLVSIMRLGLVELKEIPNETYNEDEKSSNKKECAYSFNVASYELKFICNP